MTPLLCFPIHLHQFGIRYGAGDHDRPACWRGQVTQPGRSCAEITATNTGTKQELNTTANGEGGWVIASVPNGVYTIKITAPNFKTTVLQNVKVDTAQVTTANATLEAGEASAEVVVQSGGEILNTEPQTSRQRLPENRS